MKQILLAALAALAITSCSQSDDATVPGSDSQITFNTVVNKSTRATAMVTDNFKDFTVYGYNPESSFDGTAALGTPFMDKVAATKTEGWELTDGPYYWPAKGNAQFFAYSPAGHVDDYAVGNPTGFPSFTYTIQAEQEDLLTAQVLNAAKDGNAVQLSFSHILTQINFSATLEAGFKYDITGIAVKGINNTGTFTYAAAKGAWSGTTGAVDYTYEGNFAATATDNVVNFSSGANALMLLPQTLPGDAKIEITYKATAETGNKQVTFDGTKSVEINGAWAPGQNIRYKLVLPSGAQAVTFTPIVSNWDGETEEVKNPA
ncbi:fimbrillin family protein [Bacteroides sp.]